MKRSERHSQAVQTADNVQIIAHRGCMAQYPENTLTAMRQSALMVDAIETDVRRCQTGELVAFHDATLERVTDATGVIAETPYERLQEVDVLTSGEHVPRLTDVFEAVPDDVGLNLDLKEVNVAAEVVSLAHSFDNDILLSSFDPDALIGARDAGWDALAYLFFENPTASLDIASNIGCTYVHPHYQLCVGTDFVDRAHERGFGVNAWTVETPAVGQALRAVSVDGFIVDDCTFTMADPAMTNSDQ